MPSNLQPEEVAAANATRRPRSGPTYFDPEYNERVNLPITPGVAPDSIRQSEFINRLPFRRVFYTLTKSWANAGMKDSFGIPVRRPDKATAAVPRGRFRTVVDKSAIVKPQAATYGSMFQLEFPPNDDGIFF